MNMFIQGWAIQRGGPLLVSLYTPVQTIIVGILSVVLLGDSWYLGRYEKQSLFWHDFYYSFRVCCFFGLSIMLVCVSGICKSCQAM